MGKRVVIDFSNSDQDYQNYIQNFQAKFIGELEKLVDLITASNPKSKVAQNKIINPDNWSFRYIVPDTGRMVA
ncbi:Uncharacterised protein [Legionella sainthelensi]|uniref:hypothetical protein n=1 Tax=Legionella sainthelensi TaxID=28087 RepID=UPI000E204A27|nr:hypothetical protein [Legionella sainthelensi]VEB36027.1 Uncharacterised protein [Legionella sainthelensi]